MSEEKSAWDEHNEELREERLLLPHLQEVEKRLREARGNEISADVVNLLTNLETLIRMYRRKWHEANELRDYLVGLKGWFEEAWDEEDEHFEPERLTYGHWCPTLIEEIDEMTDEGGIYVPHTIPVDAV